MGKISIEITKEVAYDIWEGDYIGLRPEHIPFKQFEILVPMGLFLTEERMTQDVETSTGVSITDSARKFIKDYISSFISIRIEYVQNKLKCVLKDSKGIKLFEFKIPDLIPIPIITYNEFAGDGFMFSYELLKLIAGVLHQLNKPTTIVLREKETKNKTGRGGKSKKSNKTYIYKTKYKINTIQTDDSSEKKRDYNRMMESWGVRGHFRRYKDKEGNVTKEVWIQPFIKGSGEARDKEYKITKL